MEKYLYAFLAAVYVALAPIHTTMLAVGILIVVDMLTGLVAAFKTNDPIESSKLRNTISKMFVYQLLVISGFYLEANLVKTDGLLLKIISGTIGITEFKSILENVERATSIKLTKRVRALFKTWDK